MQFEINYCQNFGLTVAKRFDERHIKLNAHPQWNKFITKKKNI